MPRTWASLGPEHCRGHQPHPRSDRFARDLGEGLQVQIRGGNQLHPHPDERRTDCIGLHGPHLMRKAPTVKSTWTPCPASCSTRSRCPRARRFPCFEGGAAGIVDMRSVRPFDKRGFLQRLPGGGYQERPRQELGLEAARPSSATPGTTSLAPWSASWANNKVNTTGFETIGWTNAGLGHPKLQRHAQQHRRRQLDHPGQCRPMPAAAR